MIAAIFLVAGAVAVFAYFTWAVRYHFFSTRMPGPMQAISVLALLALIFGSYSVLRTPPPFWRILTAGVGILAALTLFHSAIRATHGRGLALAFDPLVPAGLVRTGPYAYVRHPFYLSYILFWASLTLAAPDWPMLVLVLGLTGLYVQSAIREEQAILRSPHAAAYQLVRAQTGFLWPRLVRKAGL